MERSLGAEFFDELAVMVDTFRPLELGEGGRASEDRPTPGAGRDEGRPMTHAGDRARGPMTAIDIPDGSPFGPDNLPYGVFSTPGTAPRVGVRIGDTRRRPGRPRSAPTGPTPRSPRRR